MKRTIYLAACTFLLTGILPTLSHAQEAPRFSRVAVIDISEVFKNHKRFKAKMDEIKNEIEAFDKVLRDKRKQINNLITELQEYKPGSKAYEEGEKRSAKMQAELQVEMQLKRKSILNREADVYDKAYREVLDQVAQFSQRHSIDLVMRFDSKPIDPTKRDSVLKGVNRAVVYQNRMDITKFIVDNLNSGLPPQNLGARPVLPSRPGTR